MGLPKIGGDVLLCVRRFWPVCGCRGPGFWFPERFPDTAVFDDFPRFLGVLSNITNSQTECPALECPQPEFSRQVGTPASLQESGGVGYQRG
jgi:hypothetical protein